jgi:hypothetical protein
MPPACAKRRFVFFLYERWDVKTQNKTKRDGGDDCWKKGLKKRSGKKGDFSPSDARTSSDPSPALSTTTGEDVQLRRDGSL